MYSEPILLAVAAELDYHPAVFARVPLLWHQVDLTLDADDGVPAADTTSDAAAAGPARRSGIPTESSARVSSGKRSLPAKSEVEVNDSADYGAVDRGAKRARLWQQQLHTQVRHPCSQPAAICARCLL